MTETPHLPQQRLPYSRTVLILGILSILTSFFLGFLLAIPTLLLATRARRILLLEPDRYTLESANLMAIGKLLAVAGFIFGGLVLFYFTARYFFQGQAFPLMP